MPLEKILVYGAIIMAAILWIIWMNAHRAMPKPKQPTGEQEIFIRLTQRDRYRIDLNEIPSHPKDNTLFLLKYYEIEDVDGYERFVFYLDKR